MDCVNGGDMVGPPCDKQNFTEGKEDNPDPNPVHKLGERRVHAAHESLFLKLLMHYSNAGVRWAQRLILDAPRLLAELHIQDLIKEFKVLLCNHPFAATIIAVITVACGIPIFIFVAFAVITLLFTFGGFLVIEGAVLAAGSFALLLCLTTMAVVFITTGFLGGLLYITYMQVESMVRLNMSSGEPASPFDSRLPQVLASLRQVPFTNRHSHARTTHSAQSSNYSNGHVHSHNSK